MPPASSSTTPTFSRTSSVHRSGIGTPSRLPSGRGHGSPGQHRDRTRRHHLGLKAKIAPSDGRLAGPITLTDILSSLRALAGYQYRAPRSVPPTAAIPLPPTLPERTKTRRLGTRSGAGDAPGRTLSYHLRRPQPATTGRPTGAGTLVAPDVARAACRPGTKGGTAPRGLPPGRAWTRNRRMQSGGRS